MLAGFLCVDFKVTLDDGSFHAVDSSEMAFKIAGSLAFKKAAEQANPVLLEPIMNVTITTPEDYMGDIMGDLNGRRGKVLGMDSAGKSQNSYRGLVKVLRGAHNARNYSQCDSLLLGDKCGAHTFPYLEVDNPSAVVEHEATTSKIGEDQIFYCNQRGIDTENAISLIVNGYAKEVLNKLPMEFAVEAQKLLAITLEGSVG